jgi:hypothetical protein
MPAVALLLFAACSTTTPRVSRIQQDKSPTGFVYALPRTVFQVSYKVSKTDFEKSRCHPDGSYSKSDYAGHLKRLGLEADDIKGGGSLVSVSDGVLSIASEPDPDNVFVVEKVKGSHADSMLKLTLGPDGVIQSSEGSGADKLGPSVVKTIEVVGNLVGTIVGMQGVTAASKNECEDLVVQFESRAKDREALRTTPTPHPKDALELRTAELIAAQDRIKAVFLGLKKVTTSVVKCDVVPLPGKSIELFTLYPSEGLHIPAGARCRVPALFRTEKEGGKKITVSLATRELDTTLAGKLEGSKEKVAGLFYRVPGAAHVEVETDPFVSTVALSGSRHLITQLGVVRSYPQVSGTNPRIVAEFHPETGALKSLSIEEKAPDFAAYIGALGGAGTAVLAGEKTRRESAEKEADEAEAAAEKKAAAETPLAQLQAEQALLETMVAIKKAREALAQEEAAK